MTPRREEIGDRVATCAQLAAILEVSGWPKPGNVHRTADFPFTRYEHFLAGSAAIGPVMRKAALRGVDIAQGKAKPSESRVGRYIKEATEAALAWQKGGNTHLGIVLLFTPLSIAAGKTYAEIARMDIAKLRENVTLIMRETTPRDAVDAYDTILMASTIEEKMYGKHLGRLKTKKVPSVLDEDAKERLVGEGISLYNCLEVGSSWDNIAREWATGMEISFETGYPTLTKVFEETSDVNTAIVHTFLTILSKFGDSLIARKVGLKETEFIEDAVKIGMKKTRWISERAQSILKLGGLTTNDGQKALFEFDELLQRSKGELNPGTTADLTASSLFLWLLSGFRF